MVEIARIEHEVVPSLIIQVLCEPDSLAASLVDEHKLERGYLECIIWFEGRITWEIFIAQCTPLHKPQLIHDTHRIIMLDPNESLLNVGIEFDSVRTHFYAEVEDIFTLKKSRKREQLTGPEVDYLDK